MTSTSHRETSKVWRCSRSDATGACQNSSSVSADPSTLFALAGAIGYGNRHAWHMLTPPQQFSCRESDARKSGLLRCRDRSRTQRLNQNEVPHHPIRWNWAAAGIAARRPSPAGALEAQLGLDAAPATVTVKVLAHITANTKLSPLALIARLAALVPPPADYAPESGTSCHPSPGSRYQLVSSGRSRGTDWGHHPATCSPG